jgi:hypothetical protein
MSPSTSEEWKVVANERMTDATSMGPSRSVGPVYMAGYAIECSLKALLQRRSCGFPTQGAQGHNLRALWIRTGFALRDIPNSNGHSTYYIESWCTDLRYEVTGAFPGTCNEMLAGARVLVGFLQTQLRRGPSRRRR